ncbi:uncharacterized protein TM35_000064360 [Trypanosoma theileri]|uniref:Uncharacterized protein n=1 Tax=Trypanosoma theileri TaxID=67003 RepID=A0A1X0P3J4_9TRYP|nr:uncharacterized protein TM35_000064360 [Trypanosoma theileri]ORC91431.1 hypothetical protein TM35_000064360 [Trypanosoma theileri]
MQSFDVFCAEEMLRQKRKGVEVPSPAQPYEHYLWHREARRRWDLLRGEENHSSLPDEYKSDTETVVSGIMRRNPSEESRTVPHVLNSENEVRAILSSLELLLRLFFLDPKDKVLLAAVGGFRTTVSELRSKGLLGCKNGGCPEVYILYELFSFRKLLLQWIRLNTEQQKAALETAIALVSKIRSPKYTELETLLKEVRAKSSLFSEYLENILHCLTQASLDTPYAFPSVCSDVMEAVYHHFTGPSGILLPEVSSQESGAAGNDKTASPGRVSVGNVIGVSRLTRKRPNSDSLVREEKVYNLKHNTIVTGTGHISCYSRYHARYSTPEKHASKECQFCVVCHMMETLFNGYTGSCCWSHAPTQRKITFHLKRYPEVYDAAMQRFAKLERGVVLEPYGNVPLG